MSELLQLSASELARKIASREVTPTEVLEAHLDRIEEVQPMLNALVQDDFGHARETAEEQTQFLAKTKKPLPPFFGVPCTIKEMLAYKNLKRTGGSIHHRDEVMDYDSAVVERLREAGAVPMGTTNVPELGFWFETFNVIYGRTNNPYDVTRTSGGSSGGEGALIGAGASPFGMGSDIGGSIRMPAFFCGVFGHKPTNKLVPLTGHFPFSREDMATLKGDKYPYTTLGPLARRAEDLFPLMQVLMGPDQYDQATLHNIQLQKKVTDWSQVKVFTLPSPSIHGASAVSYELEECVKKAGQLFHELGATVEELDARFFVKAVHLWFSALQATKTGSFLEMLRGSQENFSVGKELLKMMIGKADYTFPNLIVAAGEKISDSTRDVAAAMRDLAELKQQLLQKLGPNGVLILPPHSRVAPHHRAPYLTPFDFIYTGIFTVLETPATSVPMGLNEDKLPLGVQIVSSPLNDHLNFSCAEMLESTFGGWVMPEDRL